MKPKLAAFPKCYIDDLCVHHTMTVFDWIELASGLGIDGLELQRRVRLQYPRLPVILITAHYDNEIQERALSQGAAGFLHKPFDAADLLGAIELALHAPLED